MTCRHTSLRTSCTHRSLNVHRTRTAFADRIFFCCSSKSLEIWNATPLFILFYIRVVNVLNVALNSPPLQSSWFIATITRWWGSYIPAPFLPALITHAKLITHTKRNYFIDSKTFPPSCLALLQCCQRLYLEAMASSDTMVVAILSRALFQPLDDLVLYLLLPFSLQR